MTLPLLPSWAGSLSLHTSESVLETVHKFQTFANMQHKRLCSFHFHTLATLRPHAMNDPKRIKVPQIRASTTARHACETVLHPPNPVKSSYNWSHMSGSKKDLQKNHSGWASLVEQWLRICLPIQGTQVQALVQEDPTCHGATKPVRHNYWARALEPVCRNYWAYVPQLLKPACLEPMLHNKRSHRHEKPTHHKEE